MTLQEMIETLRMAAVNENTITAMTNAYNLGAEWAMAHNENICGFDVVLDEAMPPNTFKLLQPTQRKPLTDAQINVIWDSLIASPDYSREMIVRAIEAAHGIKG